MRFMYLNWCRPQSKQFVSRSFRVSVHVYEDVHSICVYTISSFAITWQLRQINKMFCFTRYLIPEICLVIWTQRITEHLQIFFDVVPYLSQKFSNWTVHVYRFDAEAMKYDNFQADRLTSTLARSWKPGTLCIKWEVGWFPKSELTYPILRRPLLALVSNGWSYGGLWRTLIYQKENLHINKVPVF